MRIKIAHLTTVDSSLRYLLLNQLRDLQEAGFEVSCVSAPGPDVTTLSGAGLVHHSIPFTRSATSILSDIRSFGALLRLFTRERFHLVHTHTPKAGFYGRVAARIAGVPAILHTSHGFLFQESTPRSQRFVWAAMERMAARCSDLVLSVNREDVETAVRDGICHPGRIMELGPGGIGIDLQTFDPTRVNPMTLREIREKLGLTDGLAVVGFVGRLVREKGVLDLLQAAAIVRRRMPETVFMFVGPIDEAKSDAVRPDVARSYGVEKGCLFTGLRQDMAALYALMDVFVLPSYREGLPRAPMEASAMGVPCIVTNVRGCRQVVEHHRNGLLMPVGNPRALADGIVKLLQDRPGRQRMGEEGRKMAVHKFDERLVFQRVRHEYGRLLSEKGISAPAVETRSLKTCS